MKSIFERVKEKFVFLVQGGYGEWGNIVDESLGVMSYKYVNAFLEIDFGIYENGFVYRYRTERNVVLFNEIKNLKDIPTLRDIMNISRSKNFDDLIKFDVVTRHKNVSIALPFRIGNEFITLLCKILR